MEATHIIKRPLITEKSTWESATRNRYRFEVPVTARKEQVRKAVQELYGVRVVKVATQTHKGKEFRTKFGPRRQPDTKSATVQLHEDDRIDLF